jgi:2-oxoglutarate dehydrogenase E2 component (dihydrolipoamide succinyltransferase)
MTELIVPSPGESITEVEIGSWLVETGSTVEKDQEVVSMESEKASLTASAPERGIIEILFLNGTRVKVGSTIARITPVAAGQEPATTELSVPESPKPRIVQAEVSAQTEKIRTTPVAKVLMKEHDLNVDDIINGLRRITKSDVMRVLEAGEPALAMSPESSENQKVDSRQSDRARMSLLREKLSSRLVAARNETAMLTTFNEIDLTAVIDLRNRYKTAFSEKHEVKLGFMSFFTLAATRALTAYPQVNSQIDGYEIVTFRYCDIGIAIQTPKGLMVPILRNTETLNLAQIELAIDSLAKRARENKITIEDLQGGTFSITNGGTFGSLLSTPILNPPQAAILGMHNIIERPVAMNGQVVIRPMMYVALSYDHRLIDGKDSVGFLRTIRDLIENPVKLLDPTGQAEKNLLSL